MNSPNDNIHTSLGVTQDKKVVVWILGRGACLKSKLHSSQQADCNWKPLNVFATHSGRQMGAAHSICTQVSPKHWDLLMGNWKVTLLNGKKQEQV